MIRNIFNIPATSKFVDIFTETLLEQYKGKVLELSDVQIFVANRRSQQTLKEAFVRNQKYSLSDSQNATSDVNNEDVKEELPTTVLPRIIPIGDLSEDEMFFEQTQGVDKIIPAIDNFERHLIFTQKIMQLPPKEGLPKFSLAQASALAVQLENLVDKVHNEELDFANLNNLVPEEYAEHWHKTLDLLKLITERWPQILQKKHQIDAAQKQNILLKLQIEQWQKNNPKTHIIAAGIYADYPQIKEFLRGIKNLPNGQIYINGLDRNLSDEEFFGADENHPQYQLARLLEFLDVRREEIADLCPSQNLQRERFVSEVMRPAEGTGKWLELKKNPLPHEAFDGLNIIACENLHNEALSAALIIREKLEDPQNRIAFVSPDRNLARMAASELERWGIVADDTAGKPLHLQPVSIFLRQLIKTAQNNFEDIDFLALVKNPFCLCGQKVADFRKNARDFEINILRKKKSEKYPQLVEWGEKIKEKIRPLANLMEQKQVDLKELIKVHLATAQNLADSEEKFGAKILWKGEAGKLASSFFADLLEYCGTLEKIDPQEYADFVDNLMSSIVVRRQYGTHPRVKIMGPMEARLNNFNTVIVAGANEGVWPPSSEADPWMSRPMKKDFGLPLPEKKVGIFAFDFANLLCQDNVYITRSMSVDNVETNKSRWLLRLETVVFANGTKIEELYEDKYYLWAKEIERTDKIIQIKEPNPCPPLDLRPKRFSATALQTLIDNPYAVFAKYVLNLYPLDAIGEEADARDYGILIHKIIEEFNNKYSAGLPQNAEDIYIELGKKIFSQCGYEQKHLIFWWAKFVKTVKWILKRESKQRIGIRRIFSENSGKMQLNLSNGNVAITAKADRIDEYIDGSLSVIDYKTGSSIPTKTAVESFKAVQLVAEGIIAAHGGYEKISGKEVKDIKYWQLLGKNMEIRRDNMGDFLSDGLIAIEKLLEEYNNDVKPYNVKSKPKNLGKDDYGKTRVLTDRVVRLLLNGVLPSKILCLTYTKAAAAEMKNRITGRLAKWAIATDKDLEKDIGNICGGLPYAEKERRSLLQRARRLFALFLDTAGGMRVQTIHGFCQDVLKRFPLEAGVSPHFDVMEDRKAKEILNNIKKEILEDKTSEEVERAIEYLVGRVSEYTFPKIMQKITENRTMLTEFLQNNPNFLENLADELNVLPDDTEESLYQDFIENFDLGLLEEMLAALKKKPKTTEEKYIEFFLEIIKNGWSNDRLEKFAEIFVGAGGKKEGIPVLTENLKQTPSVAEVAQNIKQQVAQYIKKLHNLHLYQATKSTMILAAKLIEKYENYKNKTSKIDYMDLIIKTRNLLQKSDAAQWVLYKLDGGIDHILVDEAQDNSSEQWEIIRALSEEFFAGVGIDDKKHTIFAVGDRKQSIFRFQGASPKEFENTRLDFEQRATDFKTVPLDVSFRSTPQVLDMVNTVFKSEKSKKGVAQNGEVKHLAHRVGQAGRVELWPVIEEKALKKGEEKSAFEKSATEELAKKIVLRIKRIIEEKTYIPSRNRYASYGDFLVLVRQRKQFFEEFIRECKKENIPIAGADRIKLSEQIAVQDLLSLGKFLLLPTDDLSLAEVLKSPLFGLDDDDLITLCCNRGQVSLWSRLSDYEKYQPIYKYLQHLLNQVDFSRPFEIFNRILSSGILNDRSGRLLFVERLGIEAEDGLDEFLSLTISFEQEHIPSLQEFIRWMEEDDVEIKRETSQSDIDAIRVMTVHGSKGLQAPIVILPDTVSKPLQKHELNILYSQKDNRLYFPLCADDYVGGCENAFCQNADEEMEEYRRLLYVALTRAEDVLYICAYKTQRQDLENSWYELCAEAIKEIGKETDGVFVYKSVDEKNPVYEEQKSKEKNAKPDFSWLKTPAPEEPLLAKPYRPSMGSGDDEICISPIESGQEYRYIRGTVIHKILQMGARLPKENRLEKIREFAEKNMPHAPKDQINSLADEVLALLNNPQFDEIFGENSRAEVSIMGEYKGKIISAQIDRLCVLEDCVKIVDFKTNRPAAQTVEQIPIEYLNQINAYGNLVQKIYPNKRIEKYILWTNTAIMMQIA